MYEVKFGMITITYFLLFNETVSKSRPYELRNRTIWGKRQRHLAQTLRLSHMVFVRRQDKCSTTLFDCPFAVRSVSSSFCLQYIALYASILT